MTQQLSRRLGFYVTIDDEGIHLAPDEQFFEDVDLSNWGRDLIKAYPQPVGSVFVDLKHCKRFISSFISQLILVRDFYRKQDENVRVVLLNTNRKMREILRIMSLDQIFEAP